MGWELFEKGPKSCLPFVSLWERGQMALSSGFIRKHSLKKYTHARLYFDRVNRRVGMSFVISDDAPDLFPLRKRPSSFLIAKAKTFFDYYDIKYTADAKRFKVFKSDDIQGQEAFYTFSVP